MNIQRAQKITQRVVGRVARKPISEEVNAQDDSNGNDDNADNRTNDPSDALRAHAASATCQTRADATHRRGNNTRPTIPFVTRSNRCLGLCLTAPIR